MRVLWTKLLWMQGHRGWNGELEKTHRFGTLVCHEFAFLNDPKSPTTQCHSEMYIVEERSVRKL